MESAKSTLREAVSDSMDARVVSLRQSLDDVETYTSSVLQTLRYKLAQLYESSQIWLDSIEQHEKIIAMREIFVSKSNEIIETLRSHELHMRLQSCMHQLQDLMYKEVSRQAIIFGFGGLLTGALIGVCVGFSVRNRPGYGQVPNGASNNYLMRAIVSANTRRGIDGITLSVLPTPKVVKSDDVVVQVRAVGIDMIDTQIASGYRNRLRQHLGLGQISEPYVLGRECSGIVVDVGNQVQSLEINDRVWVYLPLWITQGLMSEYVAISEKYVALKPNNISFEGAATMPYAFITFWEEVLVKSQLGSEDMKNKRVLIHLGPSSKNDGVGLLATQLLKAWGARVTISTEENSNPEGDTSAEVAQMTFLHSLKTLGAESHLIIPADHSQLPNLTQRLFDIVINTDSSQLSPLLGNFCKNVTDVVIETFPVEVHRNSKGIGALLSSVVFYPYHLFFPQKTREIDSPNRILNECRKLVESRLIVPVVAKSFLPSQYDQAFRHVAKTHESALAQATVGKSVIVFKSTFK